jgi:hypothetical protein
VRIGAGPQHRHDPAILGIRVVALLPRVPGRHKEDDVEVKGVAGLGGGSEVPVMEGVEGPAHHTQPRNAAHAP